MFYVLIGTYIGMYKYVKMYKKCKHIYISVHRCTHTHTHTHTYIYIYNIYIYI